MKNIKFFALALVGMFALSFTSCNGGGEEPIAKGAFSLSYNEKELKDGAVVEINEKDGMNTMHFICEVTNNTNEKIVVKLKETRKFEGYDDISVYTSNVCVGLSCNPANGKEIQKWPNVEVEANSISKFHASFMVLNADKMKDGVFTSVYTITCGDQVANITVNYNYKK